MSNKTNACRILDSLHIAYSLHEYEWEEDQLDATTVAAKVGLKPSQLYKTLILKGTKRVYLQPAFPVIRN